MLRSIAKLDDAIKFPTNANQVRVQGEFGLIMFLPQAPGLAIKR